MPDDVELNPGSGGATVATDEIGIRNHQLVKAEFGDDNKAIMVSPKAGLPITVGDGPGSDAFGRLRISSPITLADYQTQYDDQPLLWENVLTTGGTIAHNAAHSSVDLAVTTSAGSEVIRQTREYHRYQPGKSLLILATFGFGTLIAGQRARVGYFDANNGVYFEQDGTTTNIVLRSQSISDITVAKAAWNVDKLDGGGDSAITLDETKSQILFIDLEWLSVGRVRVGFVIDGRPIVVHEFNNANANPGAYMATANLPIRYELINVSSGSGHTIQAICSSVISEGGFELFGLPFAVNSSTTPVSVTTPLAPIISIRPKATFNSIVNRGQIISVVASVLVTSNDANIELVYDGDITGGTAPSWISVDANSIVEVDTAADNITGGTTIATFPAASGQGQTAKETEKQVQSRLPLSLDIAGLNPKKLTIAAVSRSGTANVSGFLDWNEVR